MATIRMVQDSTLARYAGEHVDALAQVDADDGQGVSFPQDFIVVPFAEQLAPPTPVPEAGLFVWQRSIVDSAGNTVSDARVECRHAETMAFADIFEDREGVTRKQNPFLVDSEGFARFYAAAGLYRIASLRSGQERVYDNVLLGVRLEDMPELTAAVQPIIEDLLEPTLEELAATLDAVPELVAFTVQTTGASTDVPADMSTQRLGLGEYQVNTNRGTLNYDVKLTIWDIAASGRVFSAMMVSKDLNSFRYRVRSIFDEASANDQQVTVEITFT